MANTVVSWDRRPDYLAYTDLTPIPGITSYVGPRGGTGTNKTSFHPGQALLSEHNLPDIMYELHPCEQWKRFKRSPLPGPKTNPDGSLIYEQWTRPGQERKPLLDFKLLPDKISSEEGWWYYEFVRRMDPRIRQRDIIMREEASAERSRMTDQRYINLHLNTPGYRTYRPAWKMIAWQVTTQDQNDKKEFVLDRLTDAQKNANTTRGSTPGLIDPALGEAAGNRIPLPHLVQKKRGPRPPRLNANNNAVTQPIQPVQPAQVPQAPQAPQVPQATQVAPIRQVHQGPQAPQTSNGLQCSQPQQSPRAGSSHDITAPFPVASTTMSPPFQDPSSVSPVLVQNDLRGYTKAQDRDRAAMPPPPFPLAPRNGRVPPAQAPGSHAEPQHPHNNPQTNTMEAKISGATDDHCLSPNYPFMSDEEIAVMSARSEEAMAEISSICEPFLETNSGIQSAPSNNLSPALMEELGLGYLFAERAKGQLPENWSEVNTPTLAQTIQAGNLAHPNPPILSGKQGTKRKEFDDENEDYHHVQLDVEKQERRPRKQVKSVHHANVPSNRREPYHDATYNSQQQYRLATSSGDARVGKSRGTAFSGPALQAAPPAQPQGFASVEDVDPYIIPYAGDNLNEEQSLTIDPSVLQQGPGRHLGTAFPSLQPFASSSYRHAPAVQAQIPDFESWTLPHEAAETPAFDDTQSGQTLRRLSPLSSEMLNGPPLNPQFTATRPASRTHHGNSGQPSGKTGNSRRYHPYAN